MKLRLLVGTALCTLGVSSSGWAWGTQGHTIVCKIAEERLTPAGKALVAKALTFRTEVLDPFDACPACAGHPSDGRVMTFIGSCNWADESRRDTFRDTYDYHFINVPKAEATFDVNRDCRGMDCVIVAVQRYAQPLAKEPSGSRQKENFLLALRFLAHFVGDLHQPLHVGFAEDLGGNLLPVKWQRTSTGPMDPTDLHKVWDSGIMVRGNVTSQDDAVTLNGEITPTELAAWQTFDLKTWAAESYALARTKAYANPDGSPVAPNAELKTPYFDAGLPVVKEQLKKAGVRLAFLINSAAAGTLPPNMLKFE